MGFKNYEETGKKYGMGGGDWMKLQVGANKIRIVSDFADYGVHFNQATKKSTVCVGAEECPLCAEGDKPKVQWLGWVIDRSDKQIKLLRIGWAIEKQIGELAKSEEYGFEYLPEYDITINKTGEGLDTEYTVLAARTNTELTNKEKTEIEEKAKDPDGIIAAMKAKLGYPAAGGKKDAGEIPIIEEEQGVDIKDVPF